MRDLVDAIKTNISQKTIDTTSAFAIIVRGMELLDNFPKLSGQQKKEYILAVAEEIAKGSDGISGTDDDLLPPSTISAIAYLVKENLIGNFVNIVTDVSKGKFDINKITATASSCFKLFCR
jgi:hypothetical protein